MNHKLQRALKNAAWDGDHLTVALLISHPDVDPPTSSWQPCSMRRIGVTGDVSNCSCP